MRKIITFFKLNYKYVLAMLGMFAAIVLGHVGCYMVSENYNKLYGNTFVMENAVVDFTDSNFHYLVDPVLDGEWELYYNQWLVTDNVSEREPTALLKPTERWTTVKVDGKNLPAEGYASYRIIIKNFPEGGIAVKTFNTPVAWRAYINGELISYYGTPTKDNSFVLKQEWVNHTKNVHIEPNSEYELIVETSYSTLGGTGAPTKISTRDNYNNYTNNYNCLLIGVAIGLLLTAICVAGVFVVTNKLHRKLYLYFGLFCISLLIALYFSIDSERITFMLTPSLDSKNLWWIEMITAQGALLTYCAYLLATKAIVASKKEMHIFLAVVIVLLVPSFFLAPYQCFYYVYATELMVYLAVVYKLAKYSKGRVIQNICYAVLILPLMGIFFLEQLDNFDVILWGTLIGYSVLAFLIVIVTVVLFASQMSKSYRTMIAGMEKEVELDKVKQKVLKAQIRPHFIFNTLTLIKNLYHKDSTKGDKAISLFSKHLRTSVDSDLYETVPFNDELDHILNYIELENLRSEDNVNLILNIEYDDFSIPSLSLQPVVENSLKYSQIQYKQDGFIEISSRLENGYIIIEIKDNGVGFDEKEVKPTSIGIINLSERLKLALKASVTTESRKDFGTLTTIKFRRRNDENSSS